MSGDWFKFYEDSIHNAKLLKLSDALYRAWTILLCFASKNGGTLPSAEDIATTLREKPAKVAEWITKLKAADLFDLVDGKFIPHDWEDRQYKVKDATAATRMQRYRDRKGKTVTDRNVTTVTSVTALRLEEETETEKKSEPSGSGAEAPHDPSIEERELFKRGKELLGSSAGGQIAKLKRAKGGNVALARAALEEASQKQSPAEYIAAIIRGPPVAQGPPPGKGGFVSILMEKHLERQNEAGTHDTADIFARRTGG